MNRQIKFRGYSLDRKGWLYGDSVRRTYPNEDGTTETWYYINPSDRAEEVRRHKENLFSSSVDPSTIGQFTGLTDRNGKAVYEGDLIKDSEFTYEVYWCDDVAAFMIEEYKSECDAPKIWLLSDFCKECEIIGNIHDDKIKEE